MDRDGADFDEFVVSRSASLLRTAWLLTGDDGQSQDLVQAALEKAWRRWGTVRAAGDPEAYVRRIVVTTYVSWWRRRWRGEVPQEDLPERPLSGDPFGEVESRLVLMDALARLSRGERAVVVLRYLHDLTEADTARTLGCSVGTVKSQHARAMTRLRAMEHLALLLPSQEVTGAEHRPG